MEQPIEVQDVIQGIWDNGGEEEENGTRDRYSVHMRYFFDEEQFDDGVIDELICSNGATSISSRAEGHQFDVGEHLGKEIEWDDLPEPLQQLLIAEVNDYLKVIGEESIA